MKKRFVSLLLAGMMAAGMTAPVMAANVTTEQTSTVAAAAQTAQTVSSVPMYRLYNPNSGEHFYTRSTGEKNNLVKLGWKDEGTGWTAPSTSSTPVYRVYNPNTGDHHYTTSKGERNSLVKAGWRDEGIGWYSDDDHGVAVYRQYNPNAKKAGSHNYTTSSGEKNSLVKAGWRDEGIGWYGVNTKAVYVVMNIPYSEFFASDKVKAADAVSSATKSKPRSTLAAGSYHVNADGSDITGVSYPVKVNDPSVLKNLKQVTDNDSFDITVNMRGKEVKTTYKGQDALFENAGTHAYYQLSSKPSYYKVLTVGSNGTFSFSETKSTAVNKLTKDADLTTGADTNYGDYQIQLDDYKATKIYGAVLHTKEGGNYAFRQMENNWLTTGDFAFSVGHTTKVHSCDLQYKDFEGAEGQTATGVTIYSDNGVDEVTFKTPLYLRPFAKNDISAAADGAQQVAVSNVPSDIKNAKVTVSYVNGTGHHAPVVAVAENAAITNGKVALKEAMKAGTEYTVSVASDNYATLSAKFTYQA